MIAYFDTSAFVPLVIDEPTSPRCAEMWNAAEQIIATRLVHVESVAAINQAARIGRLNRKSLSDALKAEETFWQAVSILELDETLMRRAAELSGTERLRGYDAVHCAAGLFTSSIGESVAISGDTTLVAAWINQGIATLDTNMR